MSFTSLIVIEKAGLACFLAESTHSLTDHNHLTSTTIISSIYVCSKRILEFDSTKPYHCNCNVMAKHQQSKAKGNRHAKDPFSASEQLKFMAIESKRMEKINQKKFAKEKANRTAKEPASKRVKERKQRKINQPEHSLAAAFSGQSTIPHSYLTQLTGIIDSVEVSREYIQHMANADIDAVSLGFEQRLTTSDQRFREKEQDLLEGSQAMTQPFQDDELEWISTDGNRTGTTILGSRMKKFHKTVETHAQELARQLDDWNKCQAELRDMVLQYFGPEGLNQMEEGMFEVGNALSEEFKEFKKEIDAEKKRFATMIKESRNASVKQMKESEEVSDSIDYAFFHTDHVLIQKLYLRQKKIEEDFLAMLADEEY